MAWGAIGPRNRILWGGARESCRRFAGSPQRRGGHPAGGAGWAGKKPQVAGQGIAIPSGAWAVLGGVQVAAFGGLISFPFLKRNPLFFGQISRLAGNGGLIDLLRTYRFESMRKLLIYGLFRLSSG
jgi:hypothetical protein